MTALKPYHNFNLRNFNTFRVDSIAKTVYFPNTVESFIDLLSELDDYVILGGGSNVILSSTGIDKTVILTTMLDKIELEDNILKVTAGVKGAYLARYAMENSLSGFEFLTPIPCTIGGAIYQNAGAHGMSISDTFKSALVWDKLYKKTFELTKEDMNFSYRNSILKNNRYTVLEATFELEKAPKEEIKTRMDEIVEKRKYSQPSLKTPNAGSIFKNPENNSAGKLIEAIGIKGTAIGGAKISELHGNFIINKNFAKSWDILELMFFAYNKVKENYNITLHPEVIFIGEMTDKEEKIWKILQNQAL